MIHDELNDREIHDHIEGLIQAFLEGFGHLDGTYGLNGEERLSYAVTAIGKLGNYCRVLYCDPAQADNAGTRPTQNESDEHIKALFSGARNLELRLTALRRCIGEHV